MRKLIKFKCERCNRQWIKPETEAEPLNVYNSALPHWLDYCTNCLDLVISYTFMTESEPKPMTKVERHKKLCDDLNTLYARKNADYGDSFHETYLEEGFAMARIRLSDKLNRFKSLSKKDTQLVKDESIKDTLIDLANYALMTVLEMEDE